MHSNLPKSAHKEPKWLLQEGGKLLCSASCLHLTTCTVTSSLKKRGGLIFEGGLIFQIMSHSEIGNMSGHCTTV